MKHESQAPGGNKPVHTASGNGVVAAETDDVELMEIQILGQRRTLRASPVRRMSLVTGPRPPLVPPGQWVVIVEGGVSRLLHPSGIQLVPKGQTKTKGQVS